MIETHVTVPHHIEVPTMHDTTKPEPPRAHPAFAGEPASVPPDRAGLPATGPASSPWPARYALAEIPQTYDTSGRPGVFVDPQNKQQFITANGHAYPVGYDKDNGTYRIVDAENPSKPSYPVRLSPETGRWEPNPDVGLKGGGDAAEQRRQLQHSISSVQGTRDQARQELQQAERDLQYVQSQVGANPPPSGDQRYVQDLQQRVNNVRQKLSSLEQALMQKQQELDRLPRGNSY